MAIATEAVLFVFMIGLALYIARIESLFGAAMLFGIFSLLSAGMLTLMDGVDVAFTEAAVGAGISTVLFLGALSLTASEERRPPRHGIVAKVVVIATGALLAYGVLDMPPHGDPQAPIHQHVAPHYLETSEKEIGIPNVVTSVLASYRGYDTYGEVTVILTAAVGAILLLGGVPGRRSGEKEGESASPGGARDDVSTKGGGA